MITVKKFIRFWAAIAVIFSILLSSCRQNPSSSGDNLGEGSYGGSSGSGSSLGGCSNHVDSNEDGVCETCFKSVFIFFDFYAINDLHGKFSDTDDNIGVDELTTYLKRAREGDEYSIFLASGDIWQGSSESNLTGGKIMTDWMNELDFAAMSIGNHEYDWGEEFIEANAQLAKFPFLAINIYDRQTNQLASYCQPSVIIEGGGLQIGIIGAIGDCYSSIAVDKCKDVYFKVGRDLTNLVKAEANKLRSEGADYIVYMLHDGYEDSYSGGVQSVSSSDISYYYDTSLSNGYVDLVFEGHTHQGYRLIDEYGVYHLQNRGDNKGGISHVEISINTTNGKSDTRVAELIYLSKYQSLPDDPIVQALLAKYDSQISIAKENLGYNSVYRRGDTLRQIVADLYYEEGMRLWGDKYDIVLGGGFISVRSPYNLNVGTVKYGDLQSLFPFDNQIVLCSVKGRELRSKFFETSNSDYFICYGNYGEQVKKNIDANKTYYVIVDTYSAYYAPNRLTVVETGDPKVFARDLLAQYVRNGGLN